jgi:hypothetical protein
VTLPELGLASDQRMGLWGEGVVWVASLFLLLLLLCSLPIWSWLAGNRGDHASEREGGILFMGHGVRSRSPLGVLVEVKWQPGLSMITAAGG